MADRNRWWLVVIAILILAAFIVPYTLLRNVDAWYGSFLFWSLITAAAIVVNVIVSARWRDG